jgi:DNA polymerase-3 subunit gamma/tau
MSVSYLVLARKYRPQTLEDLVGQDHVARTLANAIATGRIAHAFLFTGVRGVGKTTSARLLAKCLNCVGADGTRTTASATPCNQCAPCLEIAAGHDLDVQEIDGASYNGIDEVRRLQEGVSFRPARDRFKIYIVDEVHMLSTSAWNAFLKTLEEPPAHAKFIFATTEVHKVPVTILSRCQRYDFKLIPVQGIARRLEQVLALEGIQTDHAAVQVLAREAAGSMRDAMSLLDQVIAFSGMKLTGDDVSHVLGVADRSVLHELGAALLAGDAAECLRIVARLAEQGFDIGHVAKDVLGHLRNLVVAKVCVAQSRDGVSVRELLELADEELGVVMSLAETAEVDDLMRCFQGFSRSFDDIVRSGQPRMALEMALVRLARRPPLLPLDELLSRVADLEKRLGGTTPPSGPVPRGSANPVRSGTSSGASASVSTEPPAARTRGSLALAQGAPRAGLAAEPRLSERPLDAPRPVLVPVPSPAPAVDSRIWSGLVELLRASHPALASVFEHALPLEVGPDRVVLTFEAAPFVVERASEPEALRTLNEVARQYFGAPTSVTIDTAGKAATGVRTVAMIESERREGEIAKARAAVEDHPMVREAVRLFGAHVRDVKLPSGDS